MQPSFDVTCAIPRSGRTFENVLERFRTLGADPTEIDTIRDLSARSKADQEALYEYYKAKAAAEEPRIAHFDELFRAYMQIEGRWAEPLQRQSRALLKAARMSKQRYQLLAQTHRNLAWEDYEGSGGKQ